MVPKVQLRGLLAAAGLTLALATNAVAADFFTLTSTTFKDGQMMPRRVSNTVASHNPVNPNCIGDNTSPQLSWVNAPAGTKSFALIIVEAEGRGGSSTYHFVAYGIPASVTSFAEGELTKASSKYVGGKSTHNVGVYMGPCTQPGPPHHYEYVLIATDLDPKALPPGLSRDELVEKVAPNEGPSHAKATTSIVGYFQHPG